MALFSSAPNSGDDRSERLIPFPGRATAERDRTARAPRRRARRRRQNTPWLQRNALSIAAVSLLVALLGMGFGIVQLITRPDPAPALLAVPTEVVAANVTAASVTSAIEAGPSTALPTPAPLGQRQIQATAKVLQPNYTVASGDTLGRIAAQFGTSVERIQALNNLADPRSLRIGTKLVIPPAL